MSERGNPRVRVPKSAEKGEIVTIRTLLSHPMESGLRRDPSGAVIPRHIIRRFRCALDGAVVFAVDLEPGIAANPYFAFTLRAERSGTLVFTWSDEDGTEFTHEARLTVA